MKFDPQKHRRRSIRLMDYDYSQAGAYYVTISVQNRDLLFREIVNYEMVSNEAGKMVDEQLNALLERFPNIELDVYQIMPNHCQWIIVIVEPVGATLVVARNMDTKNIHENGAGTSSAHTQFLPYNFAITPHSGKHYARTPQTPRLSLPRLAG